MMFFIAEFKKEVEEESYLPGQVLNFDVTGSSSSTCPLALGIGKYKVSS
jgi:hypothetical protein